MWWNWSHPYEHHKHAKNLVVEGEIKIHLTSEIEKQTEADWISRTL